MAQEWYLMQPPHMQLSGYESEALNDFGSEGFCEVLDSDMAIDVELYNFDLSECTEIRAVLNNRLTDTKLKTLVRHLLVPIGSCHAGMYAKVKGRFWLIVGIVDDNTVYEKAILSICNYKLSWLNDTGKPIQRWANIISASQYNNGEHENLDFTIRSDQLLISLPDDDESVILAQNKRFVIDRRCKIYEKDIDNATLVDTTKPLITYEITRVDSVLYDYQDSGLHQIMVTQDEQHPDDGYYNIDGIGYWLCDIPTSSHETNPLSCKIICDDHIIYNGIEPVAFLARFYDASGEDVEIPAYTWDISGNGSELLTVEYTDNAIIISADNKSLINKDFLLTLSAPGYDQAVSEFSVRSFM